MHRLICAKLEAVERGECRRLMIFTPPRHGKSAIVSQSLPAWFLGRNPTKQVIAASYGQDLASDFGRDVRNIIASDEYRSVFPGTALAGDSAAKDRWHTAQGGSYLAAGIGTAVTGRGSHLLVLDDVVKNRADAESEVIRNSTYDWYRSTAYTRLMPGGSVVLTMTRWHPDDLAGRLLADAQDGGDQWDLLELPALDADGCALWPELYDENALHQIRSAIGPRDWGALYQQNPQPDGSAFFDVKEALVDGEPVDAPAHCDAVFVTIDTAVKTGTKNDGTAAIFWAFSERGEHNLHVLDWEIQQIEGSLLEVWLPTVFDRLEQFAQTCGARRGSLGAFIEDKGSGSILIQQGMRRAWDVTPIDGKLTAVGKDERAISVSGYVHRQRVKLTRIAYDRVCSYKGATKNHFLTQVFGFRLGVKDQADDLLDSWAYGIAIALGNSDGF